jgi:hypothetical protein
MSSSTFNSKHEWKVALFVLGVLLATELGIRLAYTRLSNDLVHIQQIPARIERLSAGSGTRILFLGNSLTREGINRELFERKLAETTAVTVEEVYPDDTAIVEWLYGYLHFVDQNKKQLDVLLICFAEDQLLDRPSIDVRRLASSYSDANTTALIFQQELLSFDQRAEFMLARAWMSFANAERVQKRILDNLIPYYRSSARRINSTFVKQGSTKQRDQATYRRLHQLVAAAKSQDIDLIFFAFPVGNDYDLDLKLRQQLLASGASLVDARHLAGISLENFPDGYHMDEPASRLMTEHVAEQVIHWLQGSKKSNNGPFGDGRLD